MKISSEHVSDEVKKKLEKEARGLEHLENTIGSLEKEKSLYLQEKKRCLRHLIEGYPTQTLKGYELSNKVIEELGTRFPELVIED